MSKEEDFLKAVENNDINKVTLFLNDNEIDPAYNDNYAILYACNHGFYNIVKLLLNDKRVGLARQKHRKIVLNSASKEGHIEIVKLLLKDKRVNPTNFHNDSIWYANENNHTHIVLLLWSDKRVKATLNNLQPELYNKLLKQDIFKKKINNF
jgi:ankyrin repeat protein